MVETRLRNSDNVIIIGSDRELRLLFDIERKISNLPQTQLMIFKVRPETIKPVTMTNDHYLMIPQEACTIYSLHLALCLFVCSE